MNNGPTFLSGIGRSGTTIFYKVLSYHKDVYWLSPFADKYINKPKRNDWLVNNIDSWLPGYFRKRLEPVECYNFLDQSYRGFSRPFRDLVAEDVTERSKLLMRKSFSKFDLSVKSHLTTKITGWPRIGFLYETFPESKIVHIKRDGKATVNSFLNVHFWMGWQGPRNWRWGELSTEHQQLWKEHDKSFVSLAAIQYLMYMEAYEKARKLLPENKVLDIKYEDFVIDPIEQMKSAAEFMDLEWNNNFEKKIKNFNITDSNVKWKRDLTSAQQDELSAILDPHMSKYGY